jgi:TonB family protein
MSSAQAEVRSALAAYLGGMTPLPEFEQSVARLLVGRLSARRIVHSELKAAVADGTLPPESLRRLGFVDSSPATEMESTELDPRLDDDRPSPRNSARDAGEAVRPAVKAPVRTAAPAPAESVDTASDWMESRRAAPQIPECGALLGNRYRLERMVGEGGMGVVFLAVDQEVRGEMFAIKVLRPEIRANPESLRLLREEVRRTRALRHPNIVGVYSLNSDPSGVYMLMEYLDGKSLKAVLDEEFGRGMPVIRAWPMIYDVGAALAYAHDHNVVHSDIKPSNVIITSSSSCKLLDFGIARADRHRTTSIRDATAIGALTPAYACCEMFEGRAPDQSDDVYAFACVIYEMLTGRHPYGRINAVDARARKLQPAPIKVLTNRQNHALARALEFDRERRTASVEILLEGLKGMINNERDRKAWVTSAAAIVAVAAVSTGWFLEHRAAHKDSVAEAVPAVALIPTAVPAPTPPTLEPIPAARPAPKAEHGQPAARTEQSVTDPAVSARGKAAATVVADTHISPSEPAPLPAVLSGTPNKVPTAAAAPVAAPVSTAAVTTAPVAAPVAAGPFSTDGATTLEPIKPRTKTAMANALPTASITPDETPTLPATVITPLPQLSAEMRSEIDHPPFGKKLPSVVVTAGSQVKMESAESCAYPAEARNAFQTGTVVLLVYVLPDGSAANAELDANGSSGSPVLDQAAVKCMREMGNFPAKLVASKPVGYWARTKLVWSFGG